jgi:peptidoglycan hydrolase-like protein with peptidoglycan-binding domain
MPIRNYVAPGLVLSRNPAFSQPAFDLQRDLRSLGYSKGPIDGIYGTGTESAIQALQFDLLYNDGSSSRGDGHAPVSVRDYANHSDIHVTGILDQTLATCVVAMLDDPAYPKLPSSRNPAAANAAAIAAIEAMSPCPVPIPFLMAILTQESGHRHYQVPEGANADSFVTVGLDHNNANETSAITSRGYGIGQFTLFHHPPTADEMNSGILDPVKNVNQAVRDLADKFNTYVAGPTGDTQADDRIAEAGHGPLRACQYPPTHPKYMNDCSACLTSAGTMSIQSRVTPCFAGCKQTYQQTQYHPGNYSNVPVRSAIPCDWPYAVRRYNGAGPNSYDYQAEVLLRIVGRPL